MKKSMLIGLLVVGLACLVQAEGSYYEETLIVTNGQTSYSAAIPFKGYIEKIEWVQSNLGSNTMTLATFDGTTALETIFTKAQIGAASGVASPRKVGTTTAGVALTAVFGDTTNTTTMLTVPYEKFWCAGNIKMRCVVTDGTVTNKFKIYLSN
jgi:hypothetical protein